MLILNIRNKIGEQIGCLLGNGKLICKLISICTTSQLNRSCHMIALSIS